MLEEENSRKRSRKQQEEEPFTAFIKGLAVDSRIDVETAKLIIDKYEKEGKPI